MYEKKNLQEKPARNTFQQTKNTHGNSSVRTIITKPPLTEITSFTNRFEFLANEYNCPVKFEEYTFQSAAALFYALKAIENKGSFMKFQRLSAIKARAKSSQIVNEDWEEHKEFYLETANRAKFDSNPDLKKQLLKTGNATLLNNVTHLDEWMGIRKDRGYNALGKVLMRLREEYKEQEKK